MGAVKLAFEIRGHRQIENGLHWGGSAVGGFPDLRGLPSKDVVFKENAAGFTYPTAAANWSIIRTVALNFVCYRGYHSLSKAQRFLQHNLDELFHLLSIN